MFAIAAGLVFSIAFLLATGTIGAMLMLYHDKMVAALLFQPIPQNPPVYRLHIRRPRMGAADRKADNRVARPTAIRFAPA